MNNNFTFSSYINLKLNEYVESLENGVFFGQNVISGSRISGLGARMESHKHILSLNTQNSENTLFGMGFGLSIEGIPSIYLMKQHDFALLAIDHMVNTARLIKNRSNLATFLALMVVVDSGYEGPQSNLNNLEDFYSISQARISLLNSKNAIDHAFKNISREFEIFAISQKSLKSTIPSEQPSTFMDGFLLSNSLEISEKSKPVLVNCGLVSDAFELCVNYLHEKKVDFEIIRQIEINLEENTKLIRKLAKAGRKFVIFDSSKSVNKTSTHFCYTLKEKDSRVLYLKRQDSDHWNRVDHDQLQIDNQVVFDFLMSR
jgi:hypothetical protein